MSKTKIPYNVDYRSKTLTLRELYEKIFTRKPQLEKRGYHCPWLLEDAGMEQPILLTGGEISNIFTDDGGNLGKGLLLSFGPSLRDKRGTIGMFIMLEYISLKNEGNLFGSHKVDEDERCYHSLKSKLIEFKEITGIELKISKEYFE